MLNKNNFPCLHDKFQKVTSAEIKKLIMLCKDEQNVKCNEMSNGNFENWQSIYNNYEFDMTNLTKHWTCKSCEINL